MSIGTEGPVDEPRENPINGLRYAPEWAGTNIFLACQAVSDETASLMPEERVSIKNSAQRRCNTFSSGRAVARTALAQAGLPASSLPSNADGSVSWPEQVIGSVTHTDDWAIAAVAMTAMCEARCIGIDLERIQPLKDGVLRLVANDAELAELAESAGNDWPAVALFSFKESVYKCLRPLVGTFIDFQDVEIFNIASGRPTIRFLSEALNSHCQAEHLELRMAVSPYHVFTLVWLRQI